MRIEAVIKTIITAPKNNLIDVSETLNGLSGCITLPALIINTQTEKASAIPRNEVILGFSTDVDIK